MVSYDKSMSVSTIKGDIICHSKGEAVQVIKQSAALLQGDEIWISSNEKTYPCLEILVKGPYACVHYFKDDEGHAWQSHGNNNKEITFLAGDMAWKAPEYVIIPFDMAIICMEEFWDTLERSKCIDWEALWEES